MIPASQALPDLAATNKIKEITTELKRLNKKKRKSSQFHFYSHSSSAFNTEEGIGIIVTKYDAH